VKAKGFQVLFYIEEDKTKI